MRLTEASLKEWRIGLWGGLARPLLALLVAALIIPWLGLPPMQQNLLLISAALPPAVINFLLAEQYAQEPEKMASILFLGHLASLIVMPIALMVALG